MQNFFSRFLPQSLSRKSISYGTRCDVCRMVLITSLGSLLLFEAAILVPSYRNHVAKLEQALIDDGRESLKKLQYGLQFLPRDAIDDDFIAPALDHSSVSGILLTDQHNTVINQFGIVTTPEATASTPLNLCCTETAFHVAKPGNDFHVSSYLRTADKPVRVVVALNLESLHSSAFSYLLNVLGLIGLICIGVSVAIVTVMSHYAKKTEYKAYHEPDTGLPNHRNFSETLDRHASGNTALIAFQIDDFTAVMDRWGRQNARQLMHDLGQRLNTKLPDNARLYYYRAGAFTILINGQGLPAIIDSVQHTLANDLTIQHDALGLTACIGALEATPHRQPGSTDLIELVEMALSRALSYGANQVVFYEEELRRTRDERNFVITRLRSALTRNQLSLAYQLQYYSTSQTPAGAEALMRWTHPDFGAISPGVFIPLAEETGVIIEYGTWALRQAVAQYAEWRDQGLHLPRISVNLSPRQFMDAQLAETVAELLNKHQLAPGELELEITESAIISSPELAQARMEEIQKLGVEFAIDDFGTGHSTLSNLGTFPFSRLKIDQSFTRELQHSNASRVIVKSCIELAHGLGMDVVAEGVEEAQEFDTLADWNCDVIQGYYFSRPQSPENVVNELNHGLTRPQNKAA